MTDMRTAPIRREETKEGRGVFGSAATVGDDQDQAMHGIARSSRRGRKPDPGNKSCNC